MGYFFQETNSANKSLSNLDAQGNAKFADKQDKLVSGDNIKTINNISLLGSGDIQVGEGGTIVVDQSYDAASTYAQAGTAVAQAIATRASTALDNLSSGGQMIIDSANGTISNCILEIPQNIKLTLENNVLTLKAGSVVTISGSTYTTVSVASDVSRTIQTSNVKLLVTTRMNLSLLSLSPINAVGSGSSLPSDGSTYTLFFNTTDKNIYVWNGTSWALQSSKPSYPLCIVDVDSNGVASFAKDSKGRDMIFNGAGFIGHHAFIYPNVKALWSNGIDTDGTLKSDKLQNANLVIIEMATGQTYTRYNRYIGLLHDNYSNDGALKWRGYEEVDTLPDLSTSREYFRYYVKDENKIYVSAGGNWLTLADYVDSTPFIEYNYNGTSVTIFNVRQPYDGARYLLTDEIKEEVATKQADVTTLTGYDATKTQTLKNVSGVLTWVDDE